MTMLAPLSLLLTSALSLEAELSTEETFARILARHQKLESYFAVYEGEAPGGKTLNAAISFHGPSQMASVHTQFLIDGKVVAAPLQAVTPELGIVIDGQSAIQLKDASLILDKLAKVAALLFEGKERPLGNWSPALSMTRDTMAAQLSITSQPQMPWLQQGLPEGTTHAIDGDFTIFTTPEGCTSRVQSTTGILQRQNFPNQQGDRTLVLKELQTGLSAKEISTFINGYVPENLAIRNMRSHPLLGNIQHQMLLEIVTKVDNGQATHEEVTRSLEKAKPLLVEYFNAAYPPDFWPNPAEDPSLHEIKMKNMRETVKSQWGANGLKPEGLHPKTGPGEVVARLLTSTLKSEFLTFLENKTTAPKIDQEQ